CHSLDGKRATGREEMIAFRGETWSVLPNAHSSPVLLLRSVRFEPAGRLTATSQAAQHTGPNLLCFQPSGFSIAAGNQSAPHQLQLTTVQEAVFCLTSMIPEL